MESDFNLPGGQALCNTGGLISDDSGRGEILHGLVGYAATPTALQVATWAIFLVIGLAFLGRPSLLSSMSTRDGKQSTA